MVRETQLVSPHFVLQLCFFQAFFSFLTMVAPFFFLDESKGKGDLQMPVNHPWVYMAVAIIIWYCFRCTGE